MGNAPEAALVVAQAECIVRLRALHPAQQRFVDHPAKRKIARCGRRSGKTVGACNLAVRAFLEGRRVLYAVPTSNQLDTFWFEVKRALEDAIHQGYLYKNEGMHMVERRGTQNRIRGKTAWDADSLRGDFCDFLILDEHQLMSEDCWERVAQPMLLDNDGAAMFLYTPPSLNSRSASKARDPRHAAKMFKAAQEDTSSEWAAFAWSSHDNPFISPIGLERAARGMTRLAYQQEILAMDATEAPGALWRQEQLDRDRVSTHPDLRRVVVAIDPAVSSNEQSDETGIVVGGIGLNGHGYVLEDASGRYSPRDWAIKAIQLFDKYKADRCLGEVNNGGELVEEVLRTVRPTISYKAVHASRGKAARAEPVAAIYEKGMVHHVGQFPLLEDQLCSYEPLGTHRSPDRLDALVWLWTELLVGAGQTIVRGAAKASSWRER